jgi:hypothetical protein
VSDMVEGVMMEQAHRQTAALELIAEHAQIQSAIMAEMNTRWEASMSVLGRAAHSIGRVASRLEAIQVDADGKVEVHW